MGRFRPFPAPQFRAIVQPIKIVKLNSMGGGGKETLRALIRKQPEEAELTPITKDEFWGAFSAAHRSALFRLQLFHRNGSISHSRRGSQNP
jgi:hypothetical protein